MQRLFRGWRSTGLQLIKGGSSSIAQCHSRFYPISPSPPIFNRRFHAMAKSQPSFISILNPARIQAFSGPLHPVLILQRRMKSKLKKYKIKGYSSWKERFLVLPNGQIQRGRSGKRHNASTKTKRAKRQLRKPALLAPVYAKVLKKLNFKG
eukprot:TRINITY_DN37913_c0_g1_i1.p1 TRINITY_DN37913_c0_g1~~TRINITY_DN37913_c0_g1_i1.p1  ORF type:complete len:151 (+),score=13.06 TRINITY_DN37913_c0_g1_i1:166-618(+)